MKTKIYHLHLLKLWVTLFVTMGMLLSPAATLANAGLEEGEAAGSTTSEVAESDKKLDTAAGGGGTDAELNDPAPEAKSEQTEAVESEVQAEIADRTAEKRKQLLSDAQAALEETHNAVKALDEGNKDDALAALERATGKLDLIVARDPALALAPVNVATIIRDIYAKPETAEAMVELAGDELDEGRVQHARALLDGLASEAEVQVTNLPLATYPAAIRSVAPLIDDGKMDEAGAALQTALSTQLVESHIVPLPKLRATAKLAEAEKLAEKEQRSDEENERLHALIEDARSDLKLGEILGYGIGGDYEELYDQLDVIQEKTEHGKSGKGFFRDIKKSLKNFKDRVFQ